jgi:hypothetical protein
MAITHEEYEQYQENLEFGEESTSLGALLGGYAREGLADGGDRNDFDRRVRLDLQCVAHDTKEKFSTLRKYSREVFHRQAEKKATHSTRKGNSNDLTRK